MASAVFFWLDVAFYVFAIACGLHSVMSNRTAQGTLAWLFALFAIPYGAVPAYLVFGRRRYVAYAAAMRRAQKRIEQQDEVEVFLEYEEQGADHAARRLSVAHDISGRGFTTGNGVELLEDGYETFERIFDAIDEARSYVLVQFYIYRDDPLGRDLLARLASATRRGVAAYVLYDEIGCIATPNRYWRDMRDAGVTVSGFGASRGLRGRVEVNFRNHRKTVVVDGRTAFVGGNNVGDEYLGEDPRFGAWRDAHLRMEGPLVQAAQLTFQQDWEFASGQVLDLEWQPERSDEGDLVAAYVPMGPADELETGTLFFVAAIGAAKERLWIVSPYFVPDVAVMTAMKLAVLRGVEVKVIVPDRPDHIPVWLAGFDFIEEAERAGIEVYRYTGGFLHQKALLIDDDIACVGTANLDNRSFRLNFEAMVVVADEGFARAVEAMLQRDFEQSREHVEADYQERPFWFKLGVRTARLLAPVL